MIFHAYFTLYQFFYHESLSRYLLLLLDYLLPKPLVLQRYLIDFYVEEVHGGGEVEDEEGQQEEALFYEFFGGSLPTAGGPGPLTIAQTPVLLIFDFVVEEGLRLFGF